VNNIGVGFDTLLDNASCRLAEQQCFAVRTAKATMELHCTCEQTSQI
jgi:hypothetical protein